jgi:hypothetical protein
MKKLSGKMKKKNLIENRIVSPQFKVPRAGAAD